MVLMNAAQVEEQAQQWIPHGIRSWSIKRRPLIQQGQQAAIHYDARSKLVTPRMRNMSCQGRCRCPDRRDKCTICSVLRNYLGWRWHGSACASVLSCQERFLREVFFKPEIRSGTNKSPRCWNIKYVQRVLGRAVCNNMLLAHDILVCDTTYCCSCQFIGYSPWEKDSHLSTFVLTTTS